MMSAEAKAVHPKERIEIGLPFPKALEKALRQRKWKPAFVATLIKKRFSNLPGSTEADIIAMINGDLPPPDGKVWSFMKRLLPELVQSSRRVQLDHGATLAEVQDAQAKVQRYYDEIRENRDHLAAHRLSIENPPRQWGAALFVFRVTAGFTLQQLADYCDCTVETVCNWEKCRTTPILDTVKVVHELLPDLAQAVEEGRVEKPPARDAVKSPGRPPKIKPGAVAAAIDVDDVVEPSQAAPKPVLKVVPPVTAKPAVAPTVAPPAETTPSAEDIAMRRHRDAVAAEVTAKAAVAAAKKHLADLEDAITEAKRRVDDAKTASEAAELARMEAMEELERAIANTLQ